jgi:uncharacterized protein YeaO (DUF488 family)
MSVFLTAHVGSMPPREECLRVLVTKKWPRGVPKDSIDLWVKDLGLMPEILREHKKGKLSKSGLQARYYGEISQPGRRELVDDLQRRSMAGRKIVLVCDGEFDGANIRDMLKEYLEMR